MEIEKGVFEDPRDGEKYRTNTLFNVMIDESITWLAQSVGLSEISQISPLS